MFRIPLIKVGKASTTTALINAALSFPKEMQFFFFQNGVLMSKKQEEGYYLAASTITVLFYRELISFFPFSSLWDLNFVSSLEVEQNRPAKTLLILCFFYSNLGPNR